MRLTLSRMLAVPENPPCFQPVMSMFKKPILLNAESDPNGANIRELGDAKPQLPSAEYILN
jgi:hypothetical protein